MSKFKVYGTKKNTTIEARNMKELRQKAKKQGVGKILQIDDLDPCFKEINKGENKCDKTKNG